MEKNGLIEADLEAEEEPVPARLDRNVSMRFKKIKLIFKPIQLK